MNLLFMTNNGLPRNGLIALYDMGKQIQLGTTGQTLVDYTGKGNNAQLGSTAGADTNDPTFSGAGLVFGTDDYCKVASSAFDDLAQFTCITVCKGNSAGGGSLGRLYDKGYRYSAYNGKVRFIVSKEVGIDTFQGDTTAVTFGTPFMQATMYKLGNVNMFVNNVKQNAINLTTGTGNILSDASVDLFIGNSSTAIRNFDGTIYLQAWYNRILSDSEYMQAYKYLKSLMNSRGVAI